MKRIIAILLTVACAVSLLTGCGRGSGTSSAVTGGGAASDDALTIQCRNGSMATFVGYVHEKYPDIDLQVIPYSGSNASTYWRDQLLAGEMPDIYITTSYTPGDDAISEQLLDLSGYGFTANYNESQLRAVNDEGAVYLLPMYYTALGITYNKTIFEKEGWSVPNSFAELRTLADQAEVKGYRLALTDIALPGLGFQYLCNVLDTSFLNTTEGRRWQSGYLSGTTNASSDAGFMRAVSVLDEWRDIGMLCGDGSETSDDETRKMMAKGNTLFLLGSNVDFREGETEDEFGLMPYLSEDGSSNIYLMNTVSFVGLNKRLADKGNERKLADALHVMELLSTVEGLEAFSPNSASNYLLPLKEYSIPDDNDLKPIEDALNGGATAPFLYAGWEDVIVPIGNTMIDYVTGRAELSDVVNTIDESQSLLDGGAPITTVTETLSTEDCARLIGIAFGKAADADLALVSVNKWYPLPEGTDLNKEGVSGQLFALPVREMDLSAIMPTGWTGTIQTISLTGAQIADLLENGYDRNGDGNTFPYVLSAPEGFELDENETYTAVICGAAADAGELTDTGIVGMDAAADYLSQFETLQKSDLIWE